MRKALTGRQLIAALKKRADLDKPLYISVETIDLQYGRSWTWALCTGISVNTKPSRIWINGIQVITLPRRSGRGYKEVSVNDPEVDETYKENK